MWAIESYGRRSLLLTGAIGMTLSHLLISLFLTYSIKSNGDPLAWCAISSIYLYFFMYSGTWGSVVWVYNAEIFPLRVRARGSSIATAVNWLCNAVLAQVFPLVFRAVRGGAGIFWIFAGVCVGMCFYVFFCVPETAGLSLEEMEVVFLDDGSRRRGEGDESNMHLGEKLK
jgi:MFS transporter, SP family, sugar:H+ symporter